MLLFEQFIPLPIKGVYLGNKLVKLSIFDKRPLKAFKDLLDLELHFVIGNVSLAETFKIGIDQ